MFLLKFLFKCCLGKGGSALGCAPEIVVAQFRQVVVVVRLESDRALFGAHQGPPGLNFDGKGGRRTHVQVTPPVSNFNQTSKTVFSEEEETQQEFQV